MSPLSAVFQTVFPTTCASCNEVLVSGERQLCIGCLSALNETLIGPVPNNPTERMLASRMPLQAAMTLYRFRHDNAVQAVVHTMKFHGNTELCLMMGRQMGLALLHSGRFDDVDMLVPVPLHWLRRLQRGYNQSELLCRGIAEVMPRPIVTRAVERHRYTRKQSLRSGAERDINVEGAFRLRKPALVEGRHVLLVDDVLTTGATLGACAQALQEASDIRISAATFSMVF